MAAKSRNGNSRPRKRQRAERKERNTLQMRVSGTSDHSAIEIMYKLRPVNLYLTYLRLAEAPFDQRLKGF